MRRAERTDTPVGYGPRDHVCWVFRGRAAWVDAAVPFLQDGVVGHDRLLYVGDEAEGALIDELAALPERDALLDSGQLQVRPVAEAYVTGRDGVDAAAQVAEFEALSAAAVAHGYRSLRLAADVTALATSDDEAERFASYELQVDAMGARTPWTSLCGYDRDLVGARAARAAAFVHPVHHDGGDLALLARLHAGEAGQWCLSGEVDAATLGPLRLALATLPGGRRVDVDLGDLRHIDVGGMRTLVQLARRLEPTGGLVLHRPPELVTWMLARMEPVPGLEVRS